jgi:magnesium-transporting ATPase (P-type)
MPEQTAEVVERLRTEGRTGAMTGDGINDAAAPATADPGPGMATGTDVAIEAETSRSYGVICAPQPSRSVSQGGLRPRSKAIFTGPLAGTSPRRRGRHRACSAP